MSQNHYEDPFVFLLLSASWSAKSCCQHN